MIIEFFGAPTVGKTTFARKLAGRLSASGYPVDLVLSYRPAEVMEGASPRGAERQSVAAVQRVIRPIMESIRYRDQHRGALGERSLATELLALLPAESMLWSVRLRQYVTRLDRTWQTARASNAVTIFDQGFIQALCSLVFLGRAPSTALAAQALALMPPADILIRLDVPPEILRARLRERFRNQGWLERLLELDLEANLRSIGVVETVTDLLRCDGRPVITACSATLQEADASLAIVAARVERVLTKPLLAAAS